MPLSAAVSRHHLHTRSISLCGYRRDDGLFDVEAELRDTKTHVSANPERGDIKPGEPIHGMAVRMTFDDTMTIVAFETVLDDTPYRECPAVGPNFAKLAGLTIGKGFLKAAAERVGGIHGCTHIRELLQQMATVAIQTMYPLRAQRRADAERQPGYVPPALNTCYGWSSEHPRFAQWPHIYTGKDAGVTPPQPAGAK